MIFQIISKHIISTYPKTKCCPETSATHCPQQNNNKIYSKTILSTLGGNFPFVAAISFWISWISLRMCGGLMVDLTDDMRTIISQVHEGWNRFGWITWGRGGGNNNFSFVMHVVGFSFESFACVEDCTGECVGEIWKFGLIGGGGTGRDKFC